MKVKILILFVFVLFGNKITAQQLPYRSAFGMNDFQFNPAMTAVGSFMDSGIKYRQQWLGFDYAPNTASAYIQYPFVNKKMSIGATLEHDEAGPLIQNSVSLQYSYKIKFGYFSQLSIGILSRFSQYQFDGNKTIAVDDNDALVLHNRSTSMLPNFGLGLFYVSNTAMYDLTDNSFYIGIASSQLLANQLTFKENEEANLKRAIHANAIFGGRVINSFGYLEPSLWINYSHKNILHGVANITFEMEDVFWAGLSLSSDFSTALQAGIIIAGGSMKDGQLRVGFLGNYNIATLGPQQGLSIEFMTSYRY